MEMEINTGQETGPGKFWQHLIDSSAMLAIFWQPITIWKNKKTNKHKQHLFNPVLLLQGTKESFLELFHVAFNLRKTVWFWIKYFIPSFA